MLTLSGRFGDHLHRQPHQRPHVRADPTVSASEQHHIVFSGKGRHDLGDAGIGGSRQLLNAHQDGDLGVGVEACDRVDRGVQRTPCDSDWGMHPPTAASACNRPRGPRRCQKRFEAEIVGVRKSRTLAFNHAHTGTRIDAETAGLDQTFFEAPAFGAGELQVDVRVIGTVGRNLREHLRQVVEAQTGGC